MRSTVALLESQFGQVECLVPSFNPLADAKQWLDAASHGVRFVPVVDFPEKLRWWGRVNRIFPGAKRYWIPATYQVDTETQKIVETCDAILMIGGDVITLDYGPAPLLWNTGFAEFFLKRGMPVMLWGASTGPFSKDPEIEAYMAGFFRRLTTITVRETITQAYLAGLGVKDNVTLVADPAFILKTEQLDASSFWPAESVEGVLGFNISPLIQKFRPPGESPAVLHSEVVAFLRDVIEKKHFSVLLVPHVDSLDGAVEGDNSDSRYMNGILEQLRDLGSRIGMVPPGMNAAQLKYLIAQCRFFIGGRTHSTIAALSSGVPTISIAYSVKAKGLNHDLFGDINYVLETPLVSRQTLADKMNLLFQEELAIHHHLSHRIGAWQEKAQISVEVLSGALTNATKFVPKDRINMSIS